MLKLNPKPEVKTAIAIEQYRNGHPDYLIRYLRSGEPLTPVIRDFLAQILEGKIKKKRGPRGPQPGYTLAALGERTMREMRIKDCYAIHKMLADLHEPADAHRAAVAAVANELGVAESTVDKTIYPRMPKASRKIR